MDWELAIVAGSVLAVASVSRLLIGTPVTAAMVFVLIGLVLGPLLADEVTFNVRATGVRTLAEATLAIVLFSDASRIKLRALREEYSVPVRLLGVGLPLTILAGTGLALILFGALSVPEAIVLAVMLAPTDAALGQAVVTEPRLPSRIRQGLNVESGLNDGICVPLLLIALAAADVSDKSESFRHAVRIVAEEIGYGLAAGAGAGVLAAAAVAIGYRRGLMTGRWLQVVPVAGAALAYTVAAGLGGSGFIAAFIAGGVFGGLASAESEPASRLSEELGGLLGGVTLLVFGAILLGSTLKHVTWQVGVYAVLSLTIVRMLPVAIAMLGSGARWRTVAFLGWFGPRGLASIVFAIIVVEDSALPNLDVILLCTYLAVGMSVFLHGVSAAPLASRYATWYGSHPDGQRPAMESVPAAEPRLRGAIAPASAPEPASRSSHAPA
jgi:NhaP-type Na+/H+ or K+/H+ antiporter